MSEDTTDRPMVLVGRDEIAELSRVWAEYTSTTGTAPGPVDPILSLRKTGAVLRSVDRVLASVLTDDQNGPRPAPVDTPPCPNT